MTNSALTIRNGTMVVEPPLSAAYTEVAPETDAWYIWLGAAQTLAFEDPAGRFTARKRQRSGIGYWYALRRRFGQLHETYLGKDRDVTLERLRTAARKLRMIGDEATASGGSAHTVDPQPQTTRAAGFVTHAIPSKLNVPVIQPSALVQPRALHMLRQSTDQPITVVSAPAGYGKTTLLAQWVATSHLPTAWLTLDPNDNDPARFWVHVSAAFDRIVPGIDTALIPLTRVAHPQPADSFVNALISSLGVIDYPVVLIIDEYHQVRRTNVAIHEAIALLVERMPTHVHLVLASREEPPLPLAKLRAERHIVEIRAEHLRFTSDEVRQFLTERQKLRLSAEEIATLEARTEGWIAGLQMAAAALRNQTDKGKWIAEFGGAQRDIFDYFFEEVIRRLSRARRSVLLQIILLDRLTAPLCDAVTHSRNGQARLRQFEQANLFLVALDDRREWYRFHHLFASALRQYVHRLYPALVPVVYRRASAWCESNGLPIEAIDYALAANDLERAAQLLDAFVEPTLAAGYVAWLREHLERVPDAVIRLWPRLCMAHAYTLMLSGERTVFPRRVAEAEAAAATSQQALNPQELATLQGELLALRGSLRTAVGEGSPHEITTQLQQALALLPRHHALQPFVATFVGLNQWLDGVVHAAARTFADVVRSSAAVGDVFYLCASTMLRGHVSLLEGRLDDVLSFGRRALEHVAGYSDARVAAGVHLTIGKVLYERNQLIDAVDHLRLGESLRSEHTTLMLEWYPAMAYAYLATGDVAAARQTMQQGFAAWEQAEAEHELLLMWTGEHLRAHQARLWLMEGNVPAAAEWARELEQSRRGASASTGHPPTYIREWEDLVLARVYLAESKATQALALLDELRGQTEGSGRMKTLLENLVITASAHEVLKDRDAALAMLRRAIKLGQPQGFIRTFVDSGPGVQRLLTVLRAEQHERARGRPAALAAYLDALLAAYSPATSEGKRIQVPVEAALGDPLSRHSAIILPLTKREREVIALLARGATNKQIADTLVITSQTVKRHVSNIYGKLGVRRRTQAVAKALTLGILNHSVLTSPGQGA